MKRTLLIAMAALCVAGFAYADGVGHIGVYADAVAGSCDITDVAGLVTVYVVHTDADAANTSQFAIAQEPGVNMTYLSATNSLGLILGELSTGVTITYVGCKTTFPLELFSVQYFGTGSTDNCSKLMIVADPHLPSGQIEIIDCAQIPAVHQIGPVGGSAMVNLTGDCGCDIATKETTWSRIKSLYQ